MPTLPLDDVFARIPDPRRETKNKLHRLNDILILATCAVLAGAESWDDIAEYADAKKALFQTYLDLPHGVPSADTFARVFAKLDPTAFATALGNWMATACEASGLVPIALDGKSLRSSPHDSATGCLHVVSAWATEQRLILGQVAVAEGSNEIAAIPELLKLLDLKGAVVTIDAAGTQVENAKLIRQRGGHYLLAVKANQPQLLAACEAVFAHACATDFAAVPTTGHASAESRHGRVEERYTMAVANPSGLPACWPDARQVVQVNREREVNGVNATTTQYYLTSADVSAEQLGAWVRGHWGIENGLHWVLDVVFDEDGSRVRDGHAGANLAMVRRVAVSLLRRTPGRRKRDTMPTKRHRAGWDDAFLLQVLQGIKANIVR